MNNSFDYTILSEGRDKWSKDSERLILYADFMGFSNRVIGSDHSRLKSILKEFHQKMEFVIGKFNLNKDLVFAQFSDSILIAVNGVDFDMFQLITRAALTLMQTALSMQIPIKGVIAQGIFTFEEKSQLYFGKPLVEAYQLHEQIKFYGIVVHHSAERVVRKYTPYVNAYNKDSAIPLSTGAVKHYHLCWSLFDFYLSLEDKTDDSLAWLSEIECSVSGTPRIYVDNTRKIIDEDYKILTMGILRKSNDNPIRSSSIYPYSSSSVDRRRLKQR